MRKTLKYIDLCCGIGGFRVALNNIKEYKFECILSADIKQEALDTYNLNFCEKNKKTDINDLKPEEIKSFDILCAGFPCQPFSSAGQKKGFSDMRGGIIFKILEISEYHKPNFILLENVHNLITINNGECIKKITNMFENIGYNVKYEKLNSKDFKCPQSRERVYIMCTLQNEIDLTKIQNCKKETRVINEIIDISYTKTNIDYNFTKKIIDYHKLHSVYGCKIGDKRGGVKT